MPVILNSTIAIIKNNSFFINSEIRVLKYNKNYSDQNLKSIEYLKKIIKDNEQIYAFDHFYYLKLKKNLIGNIVHPSVY